MLTANPSHGSQRAVFRSIGADPEQQLIHCATEKLRSTFAAGW